MTTGKDCHRQAAPNPSLGRVNTVESKVLMELRFKDGLHGFDAPHWQNYAHCGRRQLESAVVSGCNSLCHWPAIGIRR